VSSGLRSGVRYLGGKTRSSADMCGQPSQDDKDRHPVAKLPRCLRVLPQGPSAAQLLAGAERLDASLVRIVAELRADVDGAVFGPGWPRGSWPMPRAEQPPETSLRAAWLREESPHCVASALCSASPSLLHASCLPLHFLGAGSYGTVFGGAGGSVALKFAVACPFTWFSPKHEFDTQAHLAATGCAFGVSELLNRDRAERVAHEARWKGQRGTEYLERPTVHHFAEAVRDCACVLVMERADGTLAEYFSRPWRSQPEEQGAAVGEALSKLLAAVRECGVVHNDAKIDNIGFRYQGPDSDTIFRFMDCGMSFRRETLQHMGERAREKALREGSVRDGCMLIASLISLAQALRGDRQRRACEAAAWQLATDPWFQCNGATTLVTLGEVARQRAKEAVRPVRRALRALGPLNK
jgi:hypothetical protein